MDGTAVVYCEGAFGTPAGAAANELVRHTARYEVLGVIDGRLPGHDAGEVLDGTPRGIPIFRDVDEAVDALRRPVDFFVIGLAPDGGRLAPAHRAAVRRALELSLNVDSGLDELLAEDEEFADLAAHFGASIRDLRRPPPREHLAE